MIDADMLNEFIIESSEALSTLAEELTHYEQNPDDSELINSIFRKIHTLKGSAGFLGFKNLQAVAHGTENILDCLRESKVRLSPQMVDVLLESFDACSAMLTTIEQNQSDAAGDYSDLKLKLVSTLEKESNACPNLKGDKAPASATSLKVLKSEVEAPTPIAPKPAAKKTTTNTKLNKKSETPKMEQAKKAPDSPAPKLAVAEKKKPSNVTSIADSVVKVNVQLLDKIMNTVGELVLNRNQVLQYAGNNDDADISRLSQQLNSIVSDLQNDIMKTRMQPVGGVMNKFERIVRDLARDQNKRIKLTISGKNTELDKTLLEAIRDPMTHLIRNAVDHGVESPEDRVAAGKSDEGEIIISAKHESGKVSIEIKDDGKGVDIERVLEKAISKGLVTPEEAENLPESQVLNFILQAGFSTAKEVTNISGRGVGMDVVKSNIEKIGGSVSISSVAGKGSTFTLKIPLTLAIVQALVIESNQQVFTIPQINVLELVRIGTEDTENLIEEVRDAKFFRLRGQLIPIFILEDYIGENKTDKKRLEKEFYNDKTIAILNADGNIYGLIVDCVLDTEEIVVKPLSSKLKEIHYFAGATIMGDGQVSLILDIVGFFNSVENEHTRSQTISDENEGSDIEFTQEILLVKLADDHSYGIPLCLVNRLEEFKREKIEWSGERPLIKYGNVPMPIINLEENLGLPGVSTLASTDEYIPCIVLKVKGTFFGLAVKEIMDIETTSDDINTAVADRDGLLGTTFVNEQTITVLDIHTIWEKQGFEKDEKLANENSLSGRVLLVEDSVLYRKIQTELLSEQGVDVVTANNGVEAFNILDKDHNFDLIITDIEMPLMDGYDLVKKIRDSKKPMKDLPIIALSAKVTSIDKEKGLNAGMDKYLEKLNKQEVINAIKEYISI